MRTAYKCRAYPAPEQASVLNRTFGCVRVVWNRILAWRHQRYYSEQARTNFTQASACLTAMKRDPDLAWLTQVSSVPLQQAIRHQQVAHPNFFAKRARYPRFKFRTGRQSAEYTRSGFRYRDGALFLAKMGTPLEFTWSWPAGLAVAGGNPGDACGADVRHSGSSRVQSAVKQEPSGVSPGIPVLQGGECSMRCSSRPALAPLYERGARVPCRRCDTYYCGAGIRGLLPVPAHQESVPAATGPPVGARFRAVTRLP